MDSVKIPYVIDNQSARMADVLNGILASHKDCSLDVATAYFTVGGFGLLHGGLAGLGSMRLLLGSEPEGGEDIGLRPDPDAIKGLIRRNLESMPFTEEHVRLVEDTIAFLRRDGVQVHLHTNGFLHAKCWLFYADRPGQQLIFDRFRPILAIVGSSNFTGPGLTSNRELNLAHQVMLEPDAAEDKEAADAVRWLSNAKPSPGITPANRQLLKSEVGARAIIELEQWYQKQWAESRDFKDELIAILDASKFGQQEYTPRQVYLKALYEYFQDDLGDDTPAGVRSAIELSEFQEDAVKKARKILGRYDGVLIADSVGLGKTWIGKKLLEDYAYHMRLKALVVCPASLKEMWERELRSATISARVLTQEELGRQEFDPVPLMDADVVLVDESHNFRNRLSGRYQALESILTGNGGKGKAGERKKTILISATPINNDLFDLYHQLSLITQGNRAYFAGCGIPDLLKYFQRARRDFFAGEKSAAIFNLLEEVVIRRTRSFIRRAYPDATINGTPVKFPERRLKTVRYDLERTYRGIYGEVVRGVEDLNLAPYNLEAYKKADAEKDEFEAGRQEALVGIFKSRYLKRFESSVEAFRISLERALKFFQTFESYLLDGKLLKSSDFQRAMRYLAREDEEDDATPASMAEELDANQDAQTALAGMERIDPGAYDLRRLHEAVQHDVQILADLWRRVAKIGPEGDAKLARLKDLLTGDLKGRKLLIFTHYKDTARYIHRELTDPKSPVGRSLKERLGKVKMHRIDSDADASERKQIIPAFSPKSNDHSDWKGTEKEIDILVSTDVLSEGQNLQDCATLLNYDLHWNPTRMVQRAGRIDRLGQDAATLWIQNMFPEEGLDQLLGLVERLSEKIASIDLLGLLDASVLGETVHPRSFNTLRRIREEDGSVIEEEEQMSQLASSEFLLRELQTALAGSGREEISALPDGIHSGLVRPKSRGVFFAFRTRGKDECRHFWRYVDLIENRVVENRFLIANLIACDRDTPRVVDPETAGTVFALQEKAIGDIIKSAEVQQALLSVPPPLDPVQQAVSTVLLGFVSHPDYSRQRIIQATRWLGTPMGTVQIRALQDLYKRYQKDSNGATLATGVYELQERFGERTGSGPSATGPRLTREDLQLVCFDFLSGG
jgi:superfamily II DNA or RNA helicase